MRQRDESTPRWRVVRHAHGLNNGEVLSVDRADRNTRDGDAVNTAARLQTAADPGEVLVGRTTYDATSAVIRYESAGAIAAKGKESPVEAFRAIAPYGLPGERQGRALTPFVGREGELSVLRRVIDSSLHRERAALTLLLGDAGVGKTRLAAEAIEESLEDEGILVLPGRCVPYGEADAWWPLAEAMRTALGIDADHGARRGDDPCTRSVSSAFAIGTRCARRSNARPRSVTPARLRHRAQVGSTRSGAGRGRARRAHLPSSRGAARARDPLAERPALGRRLHVAHGRRFDQPPRPASVRHRGDGRFSLGERWSPRLGRFNLISISVDPLDEPASQAMLHHLLGPEIEPRLEAELLARSGGNPFFLEELAALVRDDRRPRASPTAAHRVAVESPSARVRPGLDGPSAGEREILEDAAVLGRRGPVSALRRMATELRGETSIADA
jgi:hypothetical protein